MCVGEGREWYQGGWRIEEGRLGHGVEREERDQLGANSGRRQNDRTEQRMTDAE